MFGVFKKSLTNIVAIWLSNYHEKHMVKWYSQHNCFMFVEFKDVHAGNGWEMLFR